MPEERDGFPPEVNRELFDRALRNSPAFLALRDKVFAHKKEKKDEVRDSQRSPNGV